MRHVRDEVEPEIAVRRTRLDQDVTLRHTGRLLPRLHAERSEAASGRTSRWLVLAALAGLAVLAAAVVLRDGGEPPPEAFPGPDAETRDADDPTGPAELPLPPVGVLPRDPAAPPGSDAPPPPGPADAVLRTAPPLPPLPSSVRGLAASPPPIPTTPACAPAPCRVEASGWNVADGARALLDSDPAAAACWAEQAVRVGRKFNIPAMSASGFHHLGLAYQRMDCRREAHLALLSALCEGRRTVRTSLLEEYARLCRSTGDGCDRPCDGPQYEVPAERPPPPPPPLPPPEAEADGGTEADGGP